MKTKKKYYDKGILSWILSSKFQYDLIFFLFKQKKTKETNKLMVA